MMSIAEPWADPARCWHLEGPRLVVDARRIVCRECRRLDLSDALVDDAVLAVDELATNAILHGSAPYELRLYQDPLGWGVIDHADGVATIHACLSEAADGCPEVDEFPPCEAGRGLLLVSGLYPGACYVRAVVDVWGRPAKEVAFAFPEGGADAAVADTTTDGVRPSAAQPLVGIRQRGR